MNTLNNIITFTKPGDFSLWEQECQPIGNAYLGASFFGGISREKIVLNEKTLWIGGPAKNKPNYYGGNRPESYKYVRRVQELLKNGRYDEALELLPKLTGYEQGSGAYQLLANMYLDFPNINEEKTTDYKRTLDMDKALFTTKFSYEGAVHTRTAFANYPSNIICIKLSSDLPKRICVRISLGETHENSNIEVSENLLTYSGALLDNGLRFAAQLRVETKGGEILTGGKSLIIEHADEVVIYFTASTDYNDKYPEYRNGIDPIEPVESRLDAAQVKGFSALYIQHEADFCKLFECVKLRLNNASGMPTRPINELVDEYKITSDRNIRSMLETLYFQFGRYMLISSSRKGTLPANLQGVWNESNMPPWCCDYHINVNLQMNYWGAYNTNLAETAIPLVSFLDSLRPAGRNTAKEYYNIVSDNNNPENGWIAHTTTTPFGWTAPGWDFYWGWSTAAVAWLMQNIWEYYEFTMDKVFLEKRIYPIMKESVMFYRQWLVYDENQDRLVSTPTYSPEHGPVTIGNTYEQSLIEQLYNDFIKASEILECDAELRKQVSKDVKLLQPYHISKTGMIKEWFEEDEPDFDHSKTQPNHRHLSHLLGLYPGKAITTATPELMSAAIVSMNDRGDESTGWARAYKLNLWARTGDANRAYQILSGLLSGCTFHNLFDFHPPFQLDGNFGGSAGIAEMLLQSHEGYINPLAALPDAWQDGEFEGLCARGAFVINARWQKKQLVSLTVFSQKESECRIKCTPREIKYEETTQQFKISNDGIICFPAKEKTLYTFVF